MFAKSFLCDLIKSQTFNTTDRSAEIFTDNLLVDSKNLENLSSLIRSQGRNSHFREDLQQAAVDSFNIILYSIFFTGFTQNAIFPHINYGFDGEVGIDGRCSIAEDSCKVMNFTDVSRFNYNVNQPSFSYPNEMVMNGTDCKKRRNRRMVTIHTAIRQKKDRIAIFNRVFCIAANPLESSFQASFIAVSLK